MGVVLHQNPPRLSEKPSESLLPPKAELLSACVRLGMRRMHDLVFVYTTWYLHMRRQLLVLVVLDLPVVIVVSAFATIIGHPTFAIFHPRHQSNHHCTTNKNEDEIYFDDFSGLSIGDVADSSVSPPSSSTLAVTGELPEFVDTSSSRRGGDEDERIVIPLPKVIKDTSTDLTGATVREFGLGTDIMLTSYAGSAGFDKVTDWQYYSVDIDDDDDRYAQQERRTPIAPRPMDPNQPARTRSSSGSVVRLFLGEFTGGTIGAKLRSRGLDTRVWIKEYSGAEALALAKSEKTGLGQLQSSWLKQTLQRGNKKEELLSQMQKGEWINMASRRYVDGITNTPTRTDDENVISLLELTFNLRAQFTCLLGELNLNDYYDDDDPNPNEWYKALGVKPPIPGSLWLVFDYHGLSTSASYSAPHIVQRSKLPPKRGIFGGIVEPPALPPYTERCRYVIQGVLKGMLTALATAHNANIVHRSIGRNSFILSSIGQDKREATSPYATVLTRLRVILSDWGFSALAIDAVREKEFGIRLRMFDIPGANKIMSDRITTIAIDFAKAEDLNALGFVFLGLLFTTLAEPATLTAPMPATDDDTWQRLFTDIFDKDMFQFRDYCANEDVWDSVVGLLDKENGAGWDLLGSLLLSRERLRDWYNKGEENSGIDAISASSLVSHPFFKVI